MGKKGKIRSEKWNPSALTRKCPFISKPFDYCYCASTTSLNVKNVILYCGGNYEACEIYKGAMKTQREYLKKNNILKKHDSE